MDFQALRSALSGEQGSSASGVAADKDGANMKDVGETMEDGEEGEDDPAETPVMPIRGPLPPQEGTWASCVRLLDPVEGATVECLELGG